MPQMPEKKLAELLRDKSEVIKDVVDDTARGVEDAVVRAARELQRGYERIRRVISKEP